MKNIVLILVLFSVVVASCAKKKAEKTTTTIIKTEAPVPKKELPTEVAAQPKGTTKANIPEGTDANLIAKINRTPCYGKCPVFTIELFNNGIVKYHGVAYVDKKGNFTAKASAEFIKTIQDKALSIKYLALENKYPIAPVAIADLPVTTTYIRLGNVGKQIIDNFDAPRELIDFENWLVLEFEKLDWQSDK
jgi:hypothetical protein